MTTIDRPEITREQAREFIARRISEIKGRMDEAERVGDAAGELLNNPAFVEATSRIMQQNYDDFFGGYLRDSASRNRAYALALMHGLYLKELAQLLERPRNLASDLAALQEEYQRLDDLL